MKISESYKVRKIAGENLVINQGATHSDLTKIISLNPTALYLWESLKDKEFEVTDAARLLVDKFGIDMETAVKDSQRWVDALKKESIIQ